MTEGVEQLDAGLKQRNAVESAQVADRVQETTALADADAWELIRSRGWEQKVPVLLDEP